MEVDIVKIDDFAQGIGYVNNKIIFVPKTLLGDKIKVEIVKETAKYYEGKVIKYLQKSDLRINSICPFFDKCGGCQFLNTSYENSLSLKFANLKRNFAKNNIKVAINLIKNDLFLYYRNKISLKVIDEKIGFYENKTNKLVEINYCYLCKEAINNLIKDYKYLNIKSGTLTIRCNYNNELLIIIKSEEKPIIDLKYLRENHKIVGIIYNDQVIYGKNNFIEIINNFLFEVSYDSFFQVNNFITPKIFDLIQIYLNEEDIVLDLYSGVGTLSINASVKVKHVYGVEVIKNAVINSLKNKKMNKINNVDFILNDLSKKIDINIPNINTFIIDPPRSGLDKKVKELIKEKLPEKIIYISCNPSTLFRDIKELESYEVKKVTMFDMFSFTHHVECGVLLHKKK